MEPRICSRRVGHTLTQRCARARWLWQQRDRWGLLPVADGNGAVLFKEMQQAGLYSKKTATVDGIAAVRSACRLARELHRRGELA